MTVRPPTGIVEKVKAFVGSLKMKQSSRIETDSGVQNLETHPDPEDVEFLERELGIFSKSGSEGRATRGPYGNS